MLEAVAEADVVITNPEHFAVALAYDPSSDDPPRVVAKGADFTAQRIREGCRRRRAVVPVAGSCQSLVFHY